MIVFIMESYSQMFKGAMTEGLRWWVL